METSRVIRFLTTPEAIYGTGIGVVFFLLLLYRLRLNLRSVLSTSQAFSRLRAFLLNHVFYARSYWRFFGLGSTSRTHLILTLLYFTCTGICNMVQVHSLESAGTRAAKLSLINLVPMFLGGGYEFGARLLGVSLNSYGFIHRSFAIVGLLEAVAHIVIVARTTTLTWSNEIQFYGLLVCFSHR